MRYAQTLDSLSQMAAAMRVDIYEKEHAEGKGIVISIGSGLMMATMDALRTCKVALEYGKAERDNPHFPDFLSLAMEWADYVCIHAWFSITKPDRLVNLLAPYPGEKIFWKSNENLFVGHRFETFADMVTHLNDKENYTVNPLATSASYSNLYGHYD